MKKIKRVLIALFKDNQCMPMGCKFWALLLSIFFHLKCITKILPCECLFPMSFKAEYYPTVCIHHDLCFHLSRNFFSCLIEVPSREPGPHKWPRTTWWLGVPTFYAIKICISVDPCSLNPCCSRPNCSCAQVPIECVLKTVKCHW